MNKETVTLIYYRNRTGKARSLEFSTSLLRAVVLTVFIILILSIVTTYLSFTYYVRNYKLLEELRLLKVRNTELESELIDREEQLATKDLQMEEDVKEAEDTIGVDNVEQRDLMVESNKVGLENLRINETADRKGLDLYFEVVKMEKKEKRISGFVVIVGMAKGKVFTLPEGIELSDGLPVEYKKGERFRIRFRKPFKKLVPYSLDSIDSLKILVYGETGSLFLKQNVR